MKSVFQLLTADHPAGNDVDEYMSPTAVDEDADLTQQVSASDMTHKQGFNLY